MMARSFACLAILMVSVFIMGCSREEKGIAQGYIEGRYTYMATPVSGVLEQLMVARGASVKKGQLLFTLEAQPESDLYHAAIQNLEQAVSARDAITANLTYAKLTYERNKILVPKKAVSQSDLDNAASIYHSTIAELAEANANIASTEATLAETKWTYEQKTVSAPLDAIVFDTYYRIGEYTEANQPILSLLAPADIKAIFYIKESVLGAIHLNDRVSVHCDGCQKHYTGRISFISPSAEYTPPVIYSTETNEKLIYRIEAEFSAEEAKQLHPGQPINVTYYLHQSS